MSFLQKEYLEITTKVGCPVACSRYCPQDITVNSYTDKQTTLTLDNFKTALAHLPARLPVCFSGFAEPFANNQTPAFIAYAYEDRHPIGVFTTLNGVSRSDLMEIIKYEYFVFCLHLPDGHHMNIPVTTEYKDNVFNVLQNIQNVSFSIMNGKFRSDNRENFTRGLYSRELKWFRYCHKWGNPAFVMMPNGDVYLCCVDFGLRHKLGNLFTQTYDEIKRNYHPGYKLCGICSHASLLPKYVANRVIWSLEQTISLMARLADGIEPSRLRSLQ